MTNYSVLRHAAPLGEAAERYGTVRRGFMRCPFHADRVPSLKLYDDHFHCFGCGAHGDVAARGGLRLRLGTPSRALGLQAGAGALPADARTEDDGRGVQGRIRRGLQARRVDGPPARGRRKRSGDAARRAGDRTFDGGL